MIEKFYHINSGFVNIKGIFGEKHKKSTKNFSISFKKIYTKSNGCVTIYKIKEKI